MSTTPTTKATPHAETFVDSGARSARPALDLAAAIADRRVSCEAVTHWYLTRIEERNPQLRAYVTFDRDSAMREAARKDRQLRRAGSRATLPPFFGVPVGVKDLNLTRGFPTRFGSNALPLRNFYVDDRLSAQLRRAGFTILGKLATSEMGALPITEPDTHPPTRNPWDVSRTPGGSSGGSASALAAGLVPIVHGSDGAGSIRIPAAFNHLVGIKPSRGRIANAFGFDDRTILYTDGPLAHSVQDAAALLDAMAGLSVGKPHWAPRPERRYVDDAQRPPPSKLRIRVALEHPLGPTDPEIAAATVRVAGLVEAAGHEVRPINWVQTSLEEFLPLWQHLVGATPFLKLDKAQAVTRWLGEAGRKVDLASAERLAASLRASLSDWFGDADIILSPTVAEVAPPVGTSHANGRSPAEVFARAALLGGFTAVYNVSGQPAVSLPVGCTKAGLPMAVQIAGKLYDESTVIQVAAELERQLGVYALRAPQFSTMGNFI